MHALVVLGILLVVAPVAAEPAIRQIGASARLLGCTRWAAIPCDSTTQTRLGLTVVDLQWRQPGGLGPIVMFHAAARTDEHQLFSQVTVGPGMRYAWRRSWLQGGVGLTAWRHGLGPKTILADELMERARPALMGGVGHWWIDRFGAPVTLALDASSSLLAMEGLRTYQVTASLTRQF